MLFIGNPMLKRTIKKSTGFTSLKKSAQSIQCSGLLATGTTWTGKCPIDGRPAGVLPLHFLLLVRIQYVYVLNFV
jgi:hypothetical protein